MDFCTSYFGKPLTALTYQDTAAFFIEPRVEGTAFEFKSFHPSSNIEKGLDGVMAAICSFLNSEGGILIWGAPYGEKQAGGKEKVFTGELCPVPQLIEKDRLINRITSEITRPPIGIKVQILTNQNGYVYVFEVQESLTKPHQFNSQYYIRLDGQSRPAPHYIVEALMRQVTYPNLRGYLKFSEFFRHDVIPQNIQMSLSIGVFNLSELQNEEMVSIRLLCAGGHFPHGRAIIPKKDPSYSFDAHELIFDNFASILHYGAPSAHNDIIQFSQQSLQKTNGFLELWLRFGGRKSPVKVSYYLFDFNGFDFRTGFQLPHPLTRIVKYVENVTAVESMSTLNTSIEDSIRSFTER
jgi:hypothetical protein